MSGIYGGIGGGGAPTGAAGGELAGTYPNPTVAGTHSGSAHHATNHADAQHTDGPNSKTGHGAADHTDITRSIWILPGVMAQNTSDAATQNNLGSEPDRAMAISFADAATQGVNFGWIMPKDAKATTALTMVPYWAPGSTDGSAHTVRWSADVLAMPAGTTVTAAGTTTTWTGDSAARTANVAVVETGTSVLASTNADELIRADLRRIGADGADTYVGVVNILAIRIDYTATQ